MDQSKREEKTYELGELQQTYGEGQHAQIMENNISVWKLAEYGLSCLVYREPDAVIPPVRF